MHTQFDSPDARQARQKHILWLIKNHPESRVAGLPYASLDSILDGQVYQQAKNLWLKQVKAHKKPVVLGNAASFLLLHDTPTAESLLKQAQTLDPDNPEWSQDLGHLYSLQMGSQSGEKRKQSASKPLTQYERAFDATPKGVMSFYLLSELSATASEAGDPKKAEKYANDLLSQAAQYKSDWNYGNAIHHGNLVLGRLALRAGDVQKANEYLIAAGNTPGSPQLNSFGPNMQLAKELLGKGQREVVLQYLELCGKFWEMGKDELQAWAEAIKAGSALDFDANLNY